MAIYHASTKHVTRSAGRSAVAAAAYRGGCALTDARTGLVHDYTRKGGVVFSELVLPDGQAADRGQLWSAAELAEKRKDARTAREWVVALPAELDKDERAELARAFAEGLAQRYGVAVDLAVHEPSRQGSDKNHHAHLLTTTRKVSRLESGAFVLGEKSHIEHSDKARRAAGLGSGADEVKAVREMWEGMANAALARAGQEVRIDARSLKDQGLDREATVHLGPKATEMERRGTGSDRGDQNRTVETNNQARTELVSKVADLQAEQARIELSRERARQAVAAEQARRDEKTYDGLISREKSAVKAQLDRIQKSALNRRCRRSDKELEISNRRPVQPTGLFAAFKRGSYETALQSWKATMEQAKKLTSQAWSLQRRCEQISDGKPFWEMVEKRIAERYPALTERVKEFRQQRAAEEAKEKAQAEARLNAEKARSFREDKPSDSARKYPDLVNAHLWFAAAMQSAGELSVESRKDFEHNMREAIAQKIEQGFRFKDVLVAEPQRQRFTEAAGKSQDKGKDIQR